MADKPVNRNRTKQNRTRKGKPDSERIKTAQQKLSITQEEFGKLLGVSQASIFAWRDGAPVPADAWFKLAALTEDPADVERACEALGVNSDLILEIAKILGQRFVVRPKEGECFRIPRFLKGTERQPAPPLEILFSGESAGNFGAARYFIVDESSAGYGLRNGDVLLIELSGVSAGDLTPFWDELVLYEVNMEFYSGLKAKQSEWLIGYLVLREELLPQGGESFYIAEIKPWVGAEYIPRRIPSYTLPQSASVLHSEKLYESRALFEHYGGWGFPICSGWRGESSNLMDRTAADRTMLSDALKQARSEVRASPERGRIVGRAVGWIRPPQERGT